MIIRIVLSLTFLASAVSAVSQGPVDPIHFWKTVSVINPGAAAVNHHTEAVLTSNFFGIAFTKPITSHSFSVGHQVEGLGGAVGLNAGLFTQFSNRFSWAQGMYSFQTDIGGAKLGIGGSAGMLQLAFRPDPDAVGLNPASETKFDASAGVFIHATNVWLGVSMTHIPEPKFTLVTGTYNRALYVSGGGRVYMGGDFSVKPSAQWVRIGETDQLHANLTGDVNEVLQAGITMSKFLTDGAFVRLGANASVRLAEKVDVLFGFLSNPNGGPSYEGGLRLTLD